MRNITKDNQGIGILGIGAIIVLAVLICTIAITFPMMNNRYETTGEVTDKWIDYGDEQSDYLLRIRLSNGDSKMLEVDRNILHGSNYNPDHVFSEINTNHTYVFTCWGWDWQWSGWYWYPNVIIAEEI